MKPYRLSEAARQDRKDELRYYRIKSGHQVANRLVDGLKKALQELEQHPAIGSPAIGQQLGIPGLRAWRVNGFPLSLWYVERDDHVRIVRLIGQRQDPDFIAVDPESDQ